MCDCCALFTVKWERLAKSDTMNVERSLSIKDSLCRFPRGIVVGGRLGEFVDDLLVENKVVGIK